MGFFLFVFLTQSWSIPKSYEQKKKYSKKRKSQQVFVLFLSSPQFLITLQESTLPKTSETLIIFVSAPPPPPPPPFNRKGGMGAWKACMYLKAWLAVICCRTPFFIKSKRHNRRAHAREGKEVTELWVEDWSFFFLFFWQKYPGCFLFFVFFCILFFLFSSPLLSVRRVLVAWPPPGPLWEYARHIADPHYQPRWYKKRYTRRYR